MFSNREDDSTVSKENFNQVVVLEKTPYDNSNDYRQIYNQTDVSSSSRYKRLEASLDRRIMAQE